MKISFTWWYQFVGSHSVELEADSVTSSRRIGRPSCWRAAGPARSAAPATCRGSCRCRTTGLPGPALPLIEPWKTSLVWRLLTDLNNGWRSFLTALFMTTKCFSVFTKNTLSSFPQNLGKKSDNTISRKCYAILPFSSISNCEILKVWFVTCQRSRRSHYTDDNNDCITSENV